MKIKVKQKHIKNGKPCTGEGCPIALALKEQTGERWEVGDRDAISMDNYYRRIILPENVWKIIDDYDNSKKMKPFEFDFPFEP